MKKLAFALAFLATPAFAEEPAPDIDGSAVMTFLEAQLKAATHALAIDEGIIAALKKANKAMEEAKAKPAPQPPEH